MATIVKRVGGWQAKIRKKGYPALSKTFPTRTDAETWAKLTEAEMLRGVYLPRTASEKTTFGDLIARYRAEVLPTLRGRHAKSSLAILEENLGAYALVTLTPALIAKHRDSRLNAGCAPSTVRKEITLISRMIDLAGKEWGIHLATNPCAMVSKPKERNARERRLAPDEEKYLLGSCGTHMALLVKLAIETAARLGELLSLRWADVDLKRRVVRIRGLDGKETKNNDPFRAVPLSTEAVRILEQLKELPPSIDGRVFYQWKAADSFNKSWARAIKRAQMSYLEDCTKSGKEPLAGFLVDLRFHDLRHEATSRLFERGVFDSMEVASITGHKTLAMLKRYTHLRAEDLAKKLA